MSKVVESFIIKHGYPPTINTTIADIWCIWCQSEPGEIHSLACPCGERYKYFQLLGQSGIPISALSATSDFILDIDDI